LEVLNKLVEIGNTVLVVEHNMDIIKVADYIVDIGPEGGQEGAGRPKEGPKYGKDGSARGRDPLGAHDKKKGASGSPKYGTAYKGGSSLALAHLDLLKKSMGKKNREIITETSDVETEYQKEITSVNNGDEDE